MNYKFECPHCGQRIAATTSDAGSVGTCPNCQNQFTVPQPPPTGRVVHEAFSPPPLAAQPAPTPHYDPNNLRPGQVLQLLFLAGVVIVGMLFFFNGSDRASSTSSSSNDYSPPTAPIASRTEPISSISWDTIDSIYNLRNKTATDLQKDEQWKRFNGKRVRWTGKVSSVSQSLGSLTLQVKMNSDTFTSDLILTLKDSEHSKAANLQKGDSVTFVGTLNRWGTLMPISMKEGEIVR